MFKKFNDGMEVVHGDFNDLQSALLKQIYDRVIFEMLQKVENAFFSTGFLVSYVSATSVNVAAGVGFQTDSSQLTPNPTKRLLYKDTSTTVNLQAPDASQDRIDLIVVSAAIADKLTQSRKYKSPTTSAITNENFVVLQDWEAAIEVVVGTPSITPVAPAVPAGKIKVAELLVEAVSGLNGAGAVTDTRTLMPVGGQLALNTLGYSRLPAAASTPLTTLIASIDAFLTAGLQTYTDVIENNSPATEVGNPAAGRQRLFYRDNVLFLKNSGGVKTPVGSGGGGGGGLVWTAPDGSAPVLAEEYGADVFQFGYQLGQKLVVYLKVPAGYIAGRQISMEAGFYSPSAANAFLFQTTTYLYRKNDDPINTAAGDHVSTNAALTNTDALQYRNTSFDLTTPVGQIDGFAVQAGDLLKIEIARAGTGSDTDTDEVRFLPSSTEVKFG